MLDQFGQSAQIHPFQPAFSNANDNDAALLDYVDAVEDTRVLLIGRNTMDLMCALIRCGCVGVTTLRPADRPERVSADVVIIPQALAAGCGLEVLAQARRALVPLGSIVLRLPINPPSSLVQQLNRSLRLHGFSTVRTSALAGQHLLRAELPLFGRLACA